MQQLEINQGKLQLKSVAVPQCDSDEVLVKVRAAGICGTDLELLAGYYEFTGVPGHEFVGEITGVDGGTGRRVVADINLGCGACDYCAQGMNNHCAERKVIGIKDRQGAFAEYLTVPRKNLFSIPDELPDWKAVFTEPLAAALEIPEQLSLDNKQILVIGAGRLGRLVIQVLGQIAGYKNLDVCIRNPARSEQLPAACHCIDMHAVRANYDLVIECTGSPAGFTTAIKGLRPRGTLVLKSTYDGKLSVDMSQVVVNEINLLGSRCGPMDKAIEWLLEDRIAFNEAAICHLPLSSYEQAFGLARDPRVEKVLLYPGET